MKNEDNFALVVLYYPIHEQWEYIKEKIRKEKFNIVSDYILDFSGNQIGFENLLHDIYNDYDRKESSLIQRKIALLIKSKLIVKIVAVDEKVQTLDFYTRLETLKLSLRDILTFSSDKNAFLNMHAPENRVEAKHLKHVLVSANNLWYIQNRLVNPDEQVFTDKIGKVFQAFKENKICVYDCVVIGTGVMNAIGIWKCKDIDVISNHSICGIGGVDVFKEQYNLLLQSNRKLSNKAIINDDNFYFYCYGMKFCNLELVRERYLYFSYSLEASKKKVACINSYYNFINCIDDKEVLNKEIQIELQRRSNQLISNRNLFYKIINKMKKIVKVIL